MKLYHGSSVVVTQPDVSHSRLMVDFGPGFYTTPLHEQARSWCRKFQRRTGTAFISCYELDDAALQHCRVLRFEQYSPQWLDFVVQCRAGVCRTDADIVIGGVANDRVFDTVELFLENLIDR